jgi:hypothetical protein
LSLNLAAEIQLMKKRNGKNGGPPERRQRKEHG